MTNVPKSMRWGILALVLMAADAAGQRVRIKLHNGAVFHGRVCSESRADVQLDLGHGRIRLLKSDIAERAEEKPPAEAKTESVEAKTKKDEEASRFHHFVELIQKHSKRDAAVGSRAAATTVDLRNMPMPPGSPEEAVTRFVEAIVSGKVNEAFVQWSDPDRLLDEAFPLLIGGLTSHSRRRAALALSSLYQLYFSDPAVASELKKAQPLIRTVREEGPKAIVEVKLGQVEGEDVIALLRLHENRIIDFSLMATAINDLVARIDEDIRREKLSAGLMVPILEDCLRKKRPEKKKALAAAPPEKAVKIVRKKGGFEIRKPKSWIVLPKSEVPAFAEMVLKDPSGHAFVMVISETFSADLGEFERAARSNLMRAASRVVIGKRQTLRIDRHEALRFDAEATVDQVPLHYSYLLVPTQTRSYQLIVWTLKKDHHRFVRPLDRTLASFHILHNQGQLTASPSGGKAGAGTAGPSRKGS